MHNPAGLHEGGGFDLLVLIPIFLEETGVGCLEIIKAPFAFESDFQSREIPVVGVTQALQKQVVDDLSQCLVSRKNPLVGRNVEDHGMGGDLLRDNLQQGLRFAPTDPVSNQGGRFFPKNSPVLQRESQHLREARFPRPEEPGHPHPDFFVRV